MVDAKVRYLRCAPNAAGEANMNGVPDECLLNLALWIQNKSASSITITRVDVKVIGSATGESQLSRQMTLLPFGTRTDTEADNGWYPLPGSYAFVLPGGSYMLRLRVHSASATESREMFLPLARHASPGGAYRFWGAVGDLRPTEFWDVKGLHHSHDNFAQVHGYDVGVLGGADGARSDVLPNGSRSRNKDYRVWGKPVYSIADGSVVHRRDDFPGNAAANRHPNEAEQEYIDSFPDGNGNFLTIATKGADETVLYAHMQQGSLNPDLVEGAEVRAGDYLGRVGNSGQSTGPHLHIHANRSNKGDLSWVDVPRPLTWVNARAVLASRLGANPIAAPWSPLAGQGVPTGDCAVWPSDLPVVDLREPALAQFTISASGHLWVVRKSDGKVRVAGQALPAKGFVGAFLDQNPGAVAKGVAVHGSQPYVIGTDNKVWEGRTTHWALLPGSPSVKRISIDASTGKLWCITSSNAIKSFTPATRVWATYPGAGLGRDICAHDDVPYVIGSDYQIYKGIGAAGWTLLPGGGKGKRIGINKKTGKLWAIGENDGVYAYHGAAGWNEHAWGGRARELYVHLGVPYIIARDGNALWKSAGANGWHRMNVVEPC
jgi:hypothetical protein